MNFIARSKQLENSWCPYWQISGAWARPISGKLIQIWIDLAHASEIENSKKRLSFPEIRSASRPEKFMDGFSRIWQYGLTIFDLFKYLAAACNALFRILNQWKPFIYLFPYQFAISYLVKVIRILILI